MLVRTSLIVIIPPDLEATSFLGIHDMNMTMYNDNVSYYSALPMLNINVDLMIFTPVF
jgi:hypothetical protein